MDRRKTVTIYTYSAIHNLYTEDFGKDREHFYLIDEGLKLYLERKLDKYPVIDLGSGPGTVVDFISEKCPGVSITALDITPEFCEKLKEKFKNNTHIEIVNQDMVDYLKNTKEESVGMIIANYSIIHIPDEEVDGLLSTIKKSLVKGGVFIMSVHEGIFKGLEQDPYQVQRDVRLRTEAKLEVYVNYFRKEELEERLKKAGFTMRKIEKFSHRRVTGEMPADKIWVVAEK
ncbi:MAG: Methyltransferase [Candidatus Gottesmanbacteria bacterium GW2011_GWC2_39_8]|uniref:Methyltransferase n=1 Tax=Candidatus Gottesmanbacteria bacterium GW2011_GWC2_39_8 TaxID=1618450 RepID=A0A0G0Q111_9BACT|nr:MAG: Methyltransferase [Candidatus Gottesmanbacteria bacterium GW2011_GWC2_39_8]